MTRTNALAGNLVVLRREIAAQTFIAIVNNALDDTFTVCRDRPAPSLLGGRAWLADLRTEHESLRSAIIDMAERCGVAPASLAWELGEGAPRF